MPDNLDPVRRNSIVNQLLPRFLTGHQVETHIVAGPALPKTVAGIGDHGDQRNSLSQSQLFQHPRKNMLRQRMNTDDDMRTPALKQLAHITDATGMKELSASRGERGSSPSRSTSSSAACFAASSCKSAPVSRRDEKILRLRGPLE